MEIGKYPEHMVFGLDIGTRSIVGTVGYKQNERDFIVTAQSVRFHESRAMFDGQIHDIGKVADTIMMVKRDLEKQLGRTLTEVCIAAAGRVLKTTKVNIDYDLGGETLINHEHIHSLELTAIEKAYTVINDEAADKAGEFYCVGYSVITYYLNGNPIINLEEHKGYVISADALVTFLPNEVVDGLYRAVDKAGLKVDNLTLEPIAAINVAIPDKFRLLNIALLDVGAGTSDICITKSGSITAYGMIPKAGDMITEVIVENYLVEFSEAENIKIQASEKKKSITYKDIMGLSGKVSYNEVLNETKEIVKEITKEIAEHIIELNGGKPVSAVFVVGGGGKLSTFTTCLAGHLGLKKERVAVRGEEVLGAVKFMQPEIKKDSLLVTPIGICLNYYEKKNNFIFVQANGERIKLYDNGRLTIIDAALAIGFQNEKLFARRGKAINFTIDGHKRLIRGGVGEPAQIMLNGKLVSVASAIVQNDIIEIKESTIGTDAVYEAGQLPEYGSSNIYFIVNNKKISCPRFLMANGKLVSEFYSIKDGDVLNMLNYYTVSQVFEFLDILLPEKIYLNNEEAQPDDKVYENFSIMFGMEKPVIKSMLSKAGISTPQSYNELEEPDEQNVIKKPSDHDKEKLDKDEQEEMKPISIKVSVNHTDVILNGKPEYVFVDILDFYYFNVREPKGKDLMITLNGVKTEFTARINEDDMIEIYWID